MNVNEVMMRPKHKKVGKVRYRRPLRAKAKVNTPRIITATGRIGSSIGIPPMKRIMPYLPTENSVNINGAFKANITPTITTIIPENAASSLRLELNGFLLLKDFTFSSSLTLHLPVYKSIIIII